MPLICYQEKNFRAERLQLIEVCNRIIVEYDKQGFTLTLRQLYYQLVARDIIPNRQQEYDRLGQTINDARLAGIVDWAAIVDRTRNLRELSHWESPAEIIESAANSYKLDMWEGQDFRPEVWIEKDALVGVITGVCQRLDVPFFSCRGYTSQSEMWVAGMRMLRHAKGGQAPIVFHFGDHDPSGIDMTRDICARLSLFVGAEIHVKRLALNMKQVERFKPPPNPAKVTDSRYQGYVVEFGDKSWELDALEPTVLGGLIDTAVSALRDNGKWNKQVRKQKQARALLAKAAGDWDRIAEEL